MTRSELVVCERTGLWAAALRMLIARQNAPLEPHFRLTEVRSLRELSERLAAFPAIGFVEVQSANLADVLAWLVRTRTAHPEIPFVASLDRTLSGREWQTPFAPADDNRQVADALLEAGAVDVAESPRRLHRALRVAIRLSSHTHHLAAPFAGEKPLLEWAHSLLPWQA